MKQLYFGSMILLALSSNIALIGMDSDVNNEEDFIPVAPPKRTVSARTGHDLEEEVQLLNRLIGQTAGAIRKTDKLYHVIKGDSIQSPPGDHTSLRRNVSNVNYQKNASPQEVHRMRMLQLQLISTQLDALHSRLSRTLKQT